MSNTTGGPSPTGRGSGGDGPDKTRQNHHAVPQPTISNQQLLVLDTSLLPPLEEDQARQLAIVQIEFARDVSNLAAAAYQRVLETLTTRQG
jgi:hypothetical protein